MNIQIIDRLIERIEQAQYFNMDKIWSDDKDGPRPCCIGGHILALRGVEVPDDWVSTWLHGDLVVGTAAEALGIPRKLAEKLVWPTYLDSCSFSLDEISKAAAVHVLRELKETGKVRWRKAIELHPIN